ncbi:hypothetical protein [Schauerella aestuarii]|uniref:hypothetical protein n=1 Tax=Schauerella aestuarii TaxID=2511204 RepID=UPI00136CC643|nr:hypothetical protein [Achromobacter aestuarii]MYZ46088.1 hypothetical protein [Achromobacter aestuarii]
MSLTAACAANAVAASDTAADDAVASIHSVHLPSISIQNAPVAQSRTFEGHAITFPARASRSHSSAEQSEFNAKDLLTWADALPRPATVSAPEVWTMFGGRISRVSIDVRAPVAAVAKALTQARPWVSHLNVRAGEVLLSGRQGDVNWLASLGTGSTAPDGPVATRGYLSVWVPSGVRGAHRIVPLFDALPMPPAARLIFEIDDADSALPAALQVWRVPGAWKAPCADLGASLQQMGWRQDATLATTMASWRRDREVATTYCRPDGSNTLIFMHLSKE